MRMDYIDDDEDDDPYVPRIRLAVMPSPRSKFTPYFSGCADSLEDFLEEYDSLAYDCALMDPQRVDIIIRYVNPSMREFWRSLSGYHSHDWPQLRQSLVNIFGNPIPRHQIMRQKLHSHVQDSSRSRMNCTDDVSRYYRQFLCLSEPLVHSGHLSKEEHDAVFWYGFHPKDRKVLQPRLLSKRPLQPLGIPFHFEDVLSCARAVFAYDSVSIQVPSWSSEYQFEPLSARHEQLVAKHGSYTYGLQEVTCAVASNAETTTTPDDSSLPSYSTPDPHLPSSSSPSVLESQHGLVHSVTLDQPEPVYTLSTTSLPSAFPTPTHTNSLARSDVEILTTFPSPSITPAPFSMLMSDFDYLSSATVDQPAPTLSSTSPSSSSISPMFVPSATEDQSEPESTPTLFASIPTLTPTPSHVHSATDYGTIFASTPLSSSPTSSPCLPLVTEEQPEPETESIPSITPASTFAFTPPSLSTFLPSFETGPRCVQASTAPRAHDAAPLRYDGDTAPSHYSGDIAPSRYGGDTAPSCYVAAPRRRATTLTWRRQAMTAPRHRDTTIPTRCPDVSTPTRRRHATTTDAALQHTVLWRCDTDTALWRFDTDTAPSRYDIDAAPRYSNTDAAPQQHGELALLHDTAP
ncbi:hypothetical protein EDB85DRAFT_2195205 [Lactarius pseudohatsudake]|nr:hypothetical protein EDB85DRAFT_2195205 [Lactarius pseudohatsudake]